MPKPKKQPDLPLPVWIGQTQNEILQSRKNQQSQIYGD